MVRFAEEPWSRVFLTSSKCSYELMVQNVMKQNRSSDVIFCRLKTYTLLILTV
uniref:Uncharacterized protein n=1 Tax=Octopus bimaculoides TaxID=37653 RepID=A0A0L8IFT5_OCTBM